LRATYAELASVQGESGNWHEGYEYLAKSQQTAERLFRNQIDQRFTTLKVEFDTASKEKENALLMRENEANQKALKQERRARRLQAAVIVLTVVLAALLATLAIHQWRTTRRMHRLAMTDDLTGVPNRRAVLARLEPLIVAPNDRSHALIIIDIDHFKRINDEHGHPEGDEALKLVAARLRAEVHEPAFIGRLGGEEFVVVVPDADADAARQLAEHFRESVMTIDTRRWLEDRRLTVSIGLTVSKLAGDTPSHMLQRADAALYEAKRAGRNCVRQQLPAQEPSAVTRTSSGPDGVEYA
jgi:diguanylate cyclase (GGDEF)-like protein